MRDLLGGTINGLVLATWSLLGVVWVMRFSSGQPVFGSSDLGAFLITLSILHLRSLPVAPSG